MANQTNCPRIIQVIWLKIWTMTAMEPPTLMRLRVFPTRNRPTQHRKTLMAIPSAMPWMTTSTVMDCSTPLKTTAATTPLLKTPEQTQPTPIQMATASATVQTLLAACVPLAQTPSRTTLQHRWTPMETACLMTSQKVWKPIWLRTSMTTVTSGTMQMKSPVEPTRRTVLADRLTAMSTAFVMRLTPRCWAIPRTEPRVKPSKP